MTVKRTDPSLMLNATLRAQTMAMREGIAGAAETVPMPERFVAMPSEHGPFMVITDSQTLRTVEIPLHAYASVRAVLAALFAE